MKKIPINTNRAPEAIGPYSQAIRWGNTLFCSGQIPIDPSTGNISDAIEEQTTQVMINLKAVIEEAGAKINDVIKTTILLKSMDDFQTVNKIYGEFFSEPYPARATFEVARLPKDVKIEIEAIVGMS